MNSIHLNTFIIAAEERSFSRAARRLFLSTSSLMQQINLLERELGFSLFHRHYNGIELTDAGKEFYTGAKRITAIMDQTIQRSSAAANGEKLLRLSISDPALAPVLKKFALQYPDVQLHFMDIPYDGMEYGIECLENGELDLFECEYTTLIPQRKLKFQKVYETPLCAFVSFRHPLATRSFITLDDLMDEQVICYRYLFAANEALASHGFKHMQIINTRVSMAEMLNAQENGMVYLVEQATASRLWPFGAIIPLQPEIKIAYGFVYKHVTPLLQLFLDLLGE